MAWELFFNSREIWFFKWIGGLFLRVARPAASKQNQGLRDIAQAATLFVVSVSVSLVTIAFARISPEHGRGLLGIGGHIIFGLAVKLALAVWLQRLVRRVRNGVNAAKAVEGSVVSDGKEKE